MWVNFKPVCLTKLCNLTFCTARTSFHPVLGNPFNHLLFFSFFPENLCNLIYLTISVKKLTMEMKGIILETNNYKERIDSQNGN